VEAEGVRMSRMERWEWVERAERIWGIFMVATEPEAQRRRCFLLSWAWSEALKGIWVVRALEGCDEDGG
jgi:hypothetical protein